MSEASQSQPPLQRQNPADTLYFDVPLPFEAVLPVLGVPVRFQSNDPAGIAAADDAFGAWRALAQHHPALVASAGPTVRIVVHETGAADPPDAPVSARMPSADRLIMQSPGSVALVDVTRRDAVAYVTRELLADPVQVRHRLIAGMVLCVVTAFDRAPVHAAVIARGDAALLLAGEPGTGKSTLAYQAASRGGVRVLSDDAAYVQLDPARMLWGLPGRALLMPDARERFPELAHQLPRTVADGTQKIVIEYPDEWPARGAPPPVARKLGVCLLTRQRGGGTVRRTAAPAADVRAFLSTGVGLPTAARMGPALDRAIAAIAPRGGWRLALSGDPAEAMPHIEEMLKSIEEEA